MYYFRIIVFIVILSVYILSFALKSPHNLVGRRLSNFHVCSSELDNDRDASQASTLISGSYNISLVKIGDEHKRSLHQACRYSFSAWLAFLAFGKRSYAADSNSKVVYNGAIGYEAAASAFSPGQALKTVPLLPQSALLNSLPMKNELIGQLQAYFESFVQLISPLPAQQIQINNNNSVLWNNLRVNAQRAAGIFIYNKKDLLPVLRSDEISTDAYIKTFDLAERTLDKLQYDALRLVNVSGKSQVSDCLKGMTRCLNGLCDIAYLLSNPLDKNQDIGMVYNTSNGQIVKMKDLEQVSEYDRFSIVSFPILEDDMKTLPRLRGRAKVKLTFQRPGPLTIIQQPIRPLTDYYGNLLQNGEKITNQKVEKAQVKIVVDGINHPYAAGNFIDLCLKDYYSEISVKQDQFDDFEGLLSRQNSSTNTRRIILGDYKDGYIDPITNMQRRIPLEVLRKDSNGCRYTTIGAAKNSKVFDPPVPVQSFATVGNHS
jgi:hypothetical protein